LARSPIAVQQQRSTVLAYYRHRVPTANASAPYSFNIDWNQNQAVGPDATLFRLGQVLGHSFGVAAGKACAFEYAF
jgi:hypothetical protein